MNDRPFFKRSEFWFTTLGAAPGILYGIAEVFLQATQDGTLDPSNPLYVLSMKISAGLIVAYTIARQLNKAVSAFRAREEAPSVSQLG